MPTRPEINGLKSGLPSHQYFKQLTLFHNLGAQSWRAHKDARFFTFALQIFAQNSTSTNLPEEWLPRVGN
jgi:hypothetical protein